MQTEQRGFLDFLAMGETRFSIPVFQRVYSWGSRECEDFWDDTVAAARAGRRHFMGVMLYSEDPEGWHEYRRLNVIDGQQRMTTLTLLLVALSHFLRERGGTAGGLSPDDIAARFLCVGEGDGAQGKLVLSYLDRYTLFSLVGGLDVPEEHALRIMDNYGLFAEKMREEGFDADELWRGLELLEVITVLLTGEDGPQLVFESLNSKGLSLVTGDLVRNQLLMADTAEAQARLYERYWEPIERKVESIGDDSIDVTRLIHAWLGASYRSERIHDESEVYGIFKMHLRDVHGGSLALALEELLSYAERFSSDESFRRDAIANAHDWLEGRPVRFVSELKLFGD